MSDRRRDLRWQRLRRIVCRLRGHRMLQPVQFDAAGGSYVVHGCGRCGWNRVTQAYTGNRAMRRRAARHAKR